MTILTGEKRISVAPSNEPALLGGILGKSALPKG
jgi:hypothetical protein